MMLSSRNFRKLNNYLIYSPSHKKVFRIPVERNISVRNSECWALDEPIQDSAQGEMLSRLSLASGAYIACASGCGAVWRGLNWSDFDSPSPSLIQANHDRLAIINLVYLLSCISPRVPYYCVNNF